MNTESTAVQFNQQGEIYLSQGKIEEAIASCEQALKIHPNFAPAYKTLGNALQAQGRMEEARHWYAKAIEIEPNFAEVYANLGSLGAQQQKWQEAIGFYQKAIAIKPNFAGVYRNLAKVFGQINKPEEAQQCWYQAFSLEPEKVAPGEHLNMGDAFFRQEKFPEAIACYDRAIKLNPNVATAYQNLGEALKKQGKLEEATVYYRKAIELNAANARNGSEGEQTLAGATATNGAVKPPVQQPVKQPVQQAVNSTINIEDPEAYKILAEGYFAQGKLEQAIAACKKALQIKPEAPLYKMLGNALQAGGKIDEAKSCYVKAIEINPNFAEAYANYGSICAQQEQWQQAVSAYEKAISLKPDFAGAFRNFAKLLTQLGKSEEAAEAWYRAFAIDPKSGTAEEHENLAKTLIEQGKVDKGIECYRRAVELNPNAGAAYHELGEILKGQEQWEAAVDAYSNAIRNNPDLSWSHNNLAESLVKLERWEESVNAYRRAIELNPDFSWSHNNLADVLLKLERWEEAVESYRKATELNPDFSWSHNYLADALIKLGRWDEAISAYQRSIELNPDHFWAHNNLAEALVNLERWDEAVVAYRRANEVNPNFFWSQSKLGDALLEMERWEEAIDVYRRAAELNPDFPWTYYNMATAFEKLERWDESIAAYRRAAEIQADLPWLSQKLADALRMRSQWELKEAMHLYRRAIQENPDDVQLYHKALEIAPNDADLYVELANALVRHSWPDGAIVFYQMALQIRPDDKAISGRLEEVLKKKPIKNQSPVNLLNTAKSSEPVPTGAIVVSKPREIKPIETDVRLIAFYLPQFHPIPENDLWWGKGFTEWTNVTKAKPLFEGHYQPRLPADLGFYDLRLPEVRDAQARLAKKYGIYGFCYYYYWFAGKRLLDRPIDEILQSKHPDFPFCLCWANENWTRRWDGSEHEILIAQEHSLEDSKDFAESLVPFMKDERYIRVNGKPLVLIYRANILPNIEETIKLWREVWRENDVGEVYLSGCLGFQQQASQVIKWGFDAGVQFPPHDMGTESDLINPATLGANDFQGHIFDCRPIVEKSLRSKFPSEKEFLSVMTSWDNTARRGKKAHVFLHNSPEVYELWLSGVIEKTKQIYSGDERLVFVNAWNEWGEGTYLEPDVQYGHGYLSANYRALNGIYGLHTSINLIRYLSVQKKAHLTDLINGLQLRIKLLQRSIDLLIDENNKEKIGYSLLVTNIELKSQSQAMIFFDSPTINTKVNSKEHLIISGWCFDKTGIEVKKIRICHNKNTVLAEIDIYMSRPDVGEFHPQCKQLDVGFSAWIRVEDLLASESKYVLQCYSVQENDQTVEVAYLDILVKKETSMATQICGTLKTKIKEYHAQKNDVNSLIFKLLNGEDLDNFDESLDELEEIITQWQAIPPQFQRYL
ncbi:glycoside hydrolase family 99-like domain-containing protein [Microcoleus sp. Pol10D4]|uniref:glycoside hydrolase family 99-like domain-containing protein n=1 Tax=Microcoleus sp. Pol10D4 TaxID=3055387 RepID=UPI002FCFE722